MQASLQPDAQSNGQQSKSDKYLYVEMLEKVWIYIYFFDR